LSVNHLTVIPDAIGKLTNLTTLNLWANEEKQVQVPPWIAQLRNITSLDLVGFHLTAVPEWIVGWGNLAELNLSGNQLSVLPEWIAQFQNLTVLWLAHNELTGVPSSFSRLKKLQRLNLARNRISEFPSPILEIASLTELDLSENQLVNIPDAIDQLRHLEGLWLRANNLTAIPETIGKLQSLRYLILWNNRLTVLPDGMYSLPLLEELQLQDYSMYPNKNQIEEISPKILQLKNLKELNLKDNPIKVPPAEIANQGVEAIKEYFRQLEAQGTDYLYEAKLLIVGEGGAGKTTLAKKIQDPQYQLHEEDSTRGIDVIRWQFPLENGHTFQVNIWDFGGQEIWLSDISRGIFHI